MENNYEELLTKFENQLEINQDLQSQVNCQKEQIVDITTKKENQKNYLIIFRSPE